MESDTDIIGRVGCCELNESHGVAAMWLGLGEWWIILCGFDEWFRASPSNAEAGSWFFASLFIEPESSDTSMSMDASQSNPEA